MPRTVVKMGGAYETKANLQGNALEVRNLNVFYHERAKLL